MIVALFNPKAKTLHHPKGDCGHINFNGELVQIRTWASADGRHARAVGKACGTCMQISNADHTGVYRFFIPPLIAEEQG